MKTKNAFDTYYDPDERLKFGKRVAQSSIDNYNNAGLSLGDTATNYKGTMYGSMVSKQGHGFKGRRTGSVYSKKK